MPPTTLNALRTLSPKNAINGSMTCTPYNITINTGINNPDFDTSFTEAYFIHPFQIEPFLSRNNLELLKLAGAEGFSNQSEEVLLKLPKDKIEKWIEFNYKYSEDRSILGANQHIISVYRLYPFCQ